MAVAVFAYLIQITVPSFLLVLTPKQSPLRYLWMVCCAWIAYQCFSLLAVSSGGSMIRYTQLQTIILAEVLKTANLLVFTPLDRSDLVSSGDIQQPDDFLAGLCASARLFFSSIGLKTPFQIKQIPPQPPFLTQIRKGNIPRSQYMKRQLFVLWWQCLLLDIMYSLGARQASASKAEMTGASGPNQPSWGQRISMSVIAWFVIARVIIDSTYRLASLIAVAAGDLPESWPPFFGSMWDAYTLRKFWGTFWHQTVRWPFTSLSRFLIRDVFHLKRSLASRYINVLIVFLLSGFIHLITDAMQGVPPRESGALIFFPMFTLGFMVEDAAQEVWRRISSGWKHEKPSSSSSRSHVPSSPSAAVWKRAVGFIWVVVWLSLTSPTFLLPAQELSRENRRYIPISLVDHIGLRKAGYLLVSNAVIGGLGFGRVP
ncbi:membrane bound O-acyl transferase family-domain-containing protein [Aspergillus floccosus]